jgi:outer membrane protein OmpA-like peptidoglycan-associated protein
VAVFGEAHASFPLIAHPTTADIPIEVLAGLGTRVGPVDARVGAGAGLVEGYGNPRFRVLFTVSYAPGEKVAPPMLVKAEPAPKAPRIAWKEPRSPAPAAWDEPDLDPDGDIDPDEPDVEVDHDFLTLAQPVFFDSNRAHIHAQFRGELQEMARVLLKRPTLPVVWIEGHSDTQGSEDLNLGVSRQRAERVRAYLIERGVPADRLRVLAAGESRPWFSNRQERGRARNRRVMFFLQRGADPEPGQLPVVLAPPATSTKGAPQRSAMMQTNETASTAAGGDQ